MTGQFSYFQFTLLGEGKVASKKRKSSYAHLLEVISTQDKIKTFFSGMMPLSGMELSANKVEVQKTEQPDSAFKDRGENDYASKSMITEFRKEIRNSESENKMELKHLLSLTGTLARMMAVKTALQLYFFHTKKFCI